MKALLLLIALAGTAHAVGNGTLVANPPVTFVVTASGTGSVNATLQNTSAGALNVELVPDAACDPDIAFMVSGGNPFVLNGSSNKTVTFACTNARVGLERCLVHAIDANTSEPLADLEGVCDHASSSALSSVPATLDFGTIVVGGSAAKQLTLANNGPDPLSTLFFQTDELDDNFEIALPCNPDAPECDGSVPPISPGENAVTVIRCAPKSPGVHTAHLEIATDNGLHLPAKVALTCIGGAAATPVLVATPPVVTVAQPLEVVSATASSRVVLANAGTDSLHVKSIHVVDVDPSSALDWSFSLTGTCTGTPCTIAAGQQVAIELVFDPSAIGSRRASLLVTFDDTISRSRSIPLRGTGLGATLLLTRTPTTLELGTVPLGRSTSATLHFANTGNRPTTAMLGLAPIGVFSLAPPATLSVVPTAIADLLATCTPVATGPAPATITATSTDTITMTSINVGATCTGSTSPFYADQGSLDFAEVRLDDGPVTRTVDLASTGAPLALQGTAHLDAANPSISLGAPTSATTPASIDVTVTPVAEGDLVNHLIVNDVPGDALAVPIRGRVVTANYEIPTKVELGTFCVGQPTTSSNLSLVSSGTATIGVSAPALSPISNFELGLTAPSAYPATLPPSKTAVISISPRRQLTAGPIGEPLMLADNVTWTTDVGSKPVMTTEVTATFISSGGAIAPQSVPFEPQPVHLYMDNAKPIVIQNCNTTVLQLDPPTIRAPFSIDSIGFPTQLEPNESATFTVGFHPTRVGTFDDQLVITSPQVSPLVVHLTGVSTNMEMPDVDGGSGNGVLPSTTFYACSCNAHGPGGGAPILLALAAIIFRRRAGSS